ncbi:MAG TPA: penicillin-binding protein 1C, partial [Polyangiaceae bacterium]|nr:penicillin-binding protein 1C [Polyangiaceae bacterium]
ALMSVEICDLSGELAGAACPHRRREWFQPGREPHAACDMHEIVAIDAHTGLRAGPRCAAAVSRVFERYPSEYENFARQTGRPLAPREFSPRCPGALAVSEERAPELLFPSAHAQFAIDSGLRERQEIVLEARGHSERLTFYVDDQRLGTLRAPFRMPWRLAPGTHRARVATPEGVQSELVAFDVR